MAYGLPVAGQLNYADDLNNSIAAAHGKADQARATAQAAFSDAAYAKEKANRAAAGDALPVTVTAPPFRAAGDGVTDDSAAIQAAIDAAGARPVYIPAGTYLLKSQLSIPSFTEWGEAWDEDNPFRLYGAGANHTHLHYTGTDPYAIAHASIGGDRFRGQNYGVEISDFTLVGPQDFSNPAHGIGIDNTRLPHIHDIAIRGFPGGVGIHLYGHTRGGIFGARIRDCRWGNNVYTILNGHSLYDPAEMEKWSVRYAIWLDGPYDTVGKVNDTLISDNQVYDFLIGAVLIKGHGVWDPATSVGSSANTLSRGNVWFSEGARKLEEGQLDSVTSTTTMRLRQTDVLLTADDALNGYYLAVEDADGVWHRSYIADFTGATREVVLETALPFTPATGAEYRVGYADAQAKADFPNPIALQHGFYWASQYSARSIGDYFEETTWLVAHPDANSDFSIIMPEEVVNDGVYAMYEDGSAWHPRVVVADRPRGSNATPASVSASDLLLTHSEDINFNYGSLGRLVNWTGARVSTGDVVRIPPGGTEARASQASGSVSQPHVVVASLGRTYFEPGEELTFALSGIWDVNVNSFAAAGDLLVPAASGLALPVPTATATAEQVAEAIGKAVTDGSTTVRALLRGW